MTRRKKAATERTETPRTQPRLTSRGRQRQAASRRGEGGEGATSGEVRARAHRRGGAQSLRVEDMSIGRLRPWEANPRRMPPAEMASLERSISHWGMVQPIVVRKADHTVIAGHQRLEAAKALGMESVPVVYVEVSHGEAKSLSLALNRIGGEWDLPLLGSVLEELRELPDLDEGLTGFDESEADALLAELERQSAPSAREESFAEAAEALQAWREQAPTRVGAGDVWALGRHRLLCDDSLAAGALEALCERRGVDMVLTDPPYGIDYRSSLPARGRRKRAIANDEAAGFDDFLGRALPAIKGVVKRGGVIYWFAGGGGASPALAKVLLAFAEQFDLLNLLVWDKMDPGLGWRWRRSWEAIVEASHGQAKVWHGGHDKRNVLRCPHAIPSADDHPTPKPVPLLEELIQAAAPARGVVLDPFAGSGSTLIAAERTGRVCFAVELEPRYCDIILARWEALSGQQASLLKRLAEPN